MPEGPVAVGGDDIDHHDEQAHGHPDQEPPDAPFPDRVLNGREVMPVGGPEDGQCHPGRSEGSGDEPDHRSVAG